MRKTLLLLSLIALALPAFSGSLADVTLPDSAAVGGKTLALNGLGLRKKMFVKVYVGGLYLEKKSGDAAAIINADAPKRMVMRFIYSPSKSQMVEAYSEGFKNNAGTPSAALKAQMDQFLGALDAMKEGEEASVTYVPGTGTTLALRGKDVLTLPGLDFAKALFSVWLGANPPTEDLKNGLLGKS
jgi:hypothetical protein